MKNSTGSHENVVNEIIKLDSAFSKDMFWGD